MFPLPLFNFVLSSSSFSLSPSLASHQLIFITKNNSILFSRNSHFSSLLEFFHQLSLSFLLFHKKLKSEEEKRKGGEWKDILWKWRKDETRLITASHPPFFQALSRVLPSLETSTQTEKSGWKVSKQAQNFPRVLISTF